MVGDGRVKIKIKEIYNKQQPGLVAQLCVLMYFYFFNPSCLAFDLKGPLHMYPF
jgi:hypothetical protein